MSGAGVPLGRKEAERDRVAVEAEQICPACHQALWLSFFFDGFGYSDKAGPKTNIVKLFQAAYEQPEKGMRRFYYPGLGADFDPETAALASAVAGRAVSDVTRNAQGAAKSAAKEEVKKRVWDPAAKAWRQSQARGGSLVDQAEAAWKGADAAVRKQARDAGHAMRRAARAPEQFVERQLGRLRREWRGLWKDVMRHPWRAVKQAGGVLVKNTAGAAGESVGLLRDSVLLAGLFNTGVDTRLEVAEKDFKTEVAHAQHRGKIEHINVALFGYDMGGGLALAFCKRLLKEICKGGRYEGIPVRIRFMGLFDCVTNRYEDNLLTGYMPLSNAVSSELYLPDDVERCVHYAAAHELRFYKPLSIIGADPQDFRGRRQEQLFPGSQQDVGGGAEPGEDGVSDQLARYPLQCMYNRAYGAGVPMPSLKELEAAPRLYQDFEIAEEVLSFHSNYRRAVKSLVTVTRVVEPFMLRLQNPFCRPDGAPVQGGMQLQECVVAPKPLKITELPHDVEAQYKGHIAIYIQWLRMWYDQNADTATQRQGPLGLGGAVHPFANARYERLADELKYLERNARSGQDFDMQRAQSQIDGKVPPNIFVNDPQGQALYWIWRNAGQRLPEVAALYPGFLTHMHDSMAESSLEAAYGSFVMSKHYFNRRPMQRLATKPEPGFLEKLQKTYENLFE